MRGLIAFFTGEVGKTQQLGNTHAIILLDPLGIQVNRSHNSAYVSDDVAVVHGCAAAQRYHNRGEWCGALSCRFAELRTSRRCLLIIGIIVSSVWSISCRLHISILRGSVSF